MSEDDFLLNFIKRETVRILSQKGSFVREISILKALDMTYLLDQPERSNIEERLYSEFWSSIRSQESDSRETSS